MGENESAAQAAAEEQEPPPPPPPPKPAAEPDTKFEDGKPVTPPPTT